MHGSIGGTVGGWSRVRSAADSDCIESRIALILGGSAALARVTCSPTRQTWAAAAEFLAALVARERRPDRAWFEIVLGDAHDQLPQALIRAGEVLARPDLVAAGHDVRAWLRRTPRGTHLNLRAARAREQATAPPAGKGALHLAVA